MNFNKTAHRRLGLARARRGLAALVLIAGVSLLSAECSAGEPSGARPGRELGALLEACSQNILSESAMAGQKGAGLLRPPSVIANETTSAPKIMLWDEMKTSPMLNPTQDGVVVGGVGGK